MSIRPKVGLLGLTLELYEQLAPALREEREEWVRRAVVPALEAIGDVLFPGVAFTADAVAERIAHFEAAGCDAVTRSAHGTTGQPI